MILVVCMSCKYGLRVSPGDASGPVPELVAALDPSEDNGYPCFNCGGTARIIPAAEPEALRELMLHDVTPQEAVAAIHGLGLPAERDCSAAAVSAAFASSPVRLVRAHPIRHSHRCIVQHIELEDGTKIYFGSSTHGATVYRISKPHSYVKGAEHA